MGIFKPVVTDDRINMFSVNLEGCQTGTNYVASFQEYFSSTGTKACHLLHEMLVYPPKIYWPTRTIVTVGPLLSQSE